MLLPLHLNGLNLDSATAVAVVTGTSLTEAQVVAGGQQIVITLTGETWVAAGTGPIGSTADTQAIIDGISSAAFTTNLTVRSEEADNASWLKGACTVDADAGTDPDSGGTADRINVSATTAEHRIAQLVGGATGADTHTISTYVKDDGAGFATIVLAETAEYFFAVTFNLSTGATTKTDVGTSGGSVTDSGSVDVGSGWYRLWATGITGAVDDSLYQYVAASDAGTFTGNTVGLNSYLAVEGEDILTWGMQCELGTRLGQYAATTTAAVTVQDEVLGWNNEVRDKEVTTAVVRTSNTVATITLTAAAAYDVTATETITVTIPAAALTGAAEIVATPTITVAADSSGAGKSEVMYRYEWIWDKYAA